MTMRSERPRRAMAMPGWECSAGENSRVAKLTEAQAQAILDLRGSGRTKVSIAAQYGVSHACVRKIWQRGSWRHLKQRQVS